MTDLILTLIGVAVFCYVSYKFGEANERVKRGLKKRPEPEVLDFTLSRKRR